MNIQANPEAIASLGKQVKQNAQNYLAEVSSIYTQVADLAQSWTGEDNKQYVNQVNSYKSDIEKLGNTINEYGDFLNDTSKYLADVQNQIRTEAGKL